MTDPLVLCYHGLSESWAANMAISPQDFRVQLEALLGRGYHGATFADAIAGSPGGRPVVVTFDDGLRSVYELAFPVLERLGLPGTVFVPTRFLGSDEPMSWPGVDHWLGGPHEHELLPMDAEQLRTLAAAGWEIGAHSHSHPRLTRLSDAELDEELRTSKARVEAALEAPCRSLAYPFGDVDRRVARAAARVGFAAGGALAGHELRRDPLRWPRINVNRGDSTRRFELKVSPLARRLRLARARYALASLRGGAEA